MTKKTPTPHYYKILGLVPGTDYGLSYTVESFVKRLKTGVATLHLFQGADLDEQRQRIYDLVEAVRVATSPGKRTEYLEMGHDVWMQRHPVLPGEVEAVAGMDWLKLVMEEIQMVAEDVRSSGCRAFHAMVTESYTDILKHLPAHIRGDRLHLGAQEIAGELLAYRDPDGNHRADRFGLESLPVDRIRWVYQTIHSKKNDRVVLGSCKALGKRDRLLQKRKDPYLWEITLSLDYWLVANKKERQRLVHHELAHCRLELTEDGEEVPKIKGHAIEEMLSTMTYFGPLDETQSLVIHAGSRHPSIGDAGPGPLFRVVVESK